MRVRAWGVIVAASLLFVASAVSAFAQFGWAYPNYYYPSQPYYPSNPWYGPRGAPETFSPAVDPAPRSGHPQPDLMRSPVAG